MFRAAHRSKHVEPSVDGGIINSITRLHLVGYFSRDFVHSFTLMNGEKIVVGVLLWVKQVLFWRS
jgi:hypothetical protein